MALSDEIVLDKILTIRGHRVMLDFDLADLYATETSQLKRSVKRNIERLPDDFMFELTKREYKNLRYQSGTSSWGGGRYLPMAFTEQGVAMLSSVLHSKRAIAVNIQIVRIFTRMRQVLQTHKEIILRLGKVEKTVGRHGKEFKLVFEYLRQLLNSPVEPTRKIGFRQRKDRDQREGRM